jgi:AcrR family transcriptional regulator
VGSIGEQPGIQAARALAGGGAGPLTSPSGGMSERGKDGSGRVYGGEPLHARRRDQRQRLLAAAREVFAESGYAGASIDEVVARARVSRTSFYRFFANKEECMLAVFEEAIDALEAVFAEAAQAEEPEQRIRLGVRGIVGGLAADPAMARVVLVEVVGASPRLERERLEARNRFAGLLAAEMRRYRGWRRRPEREVELIALATMAALAEPVSALVARDRARSWEEIVEPLTHFALRALTPPGEPVAQASEVARGSGGVGVDELADQR